MDTHVRNLGILSMAFGLLSVVGATATLTWFGGITGLFDFGEDVGGFGLVAVAFVISHLIIGIPFAAGGRFIIQYQTWARILMIALCGVSLLLIPFGSLIAIYGLWVLMSPETEPLFSQPPRPGRNRR